MASRRSSPSNALKSAASPLRRLLDARFDDINKRVGDTRDAVVDEAERTRAALAATIERTLGRHAVDSTETIADVGTSVAAFNTELPALVERAERVTAETAEARARAVLARLSEAGAPEELTSEIVALLNYSESHRGYAAQSGLWFNPPVSLRYAPGSVEVGNVNERIVENAFAYRALGAVPYGSRVLDFGSSESTMALSLASLGYEVTALDLRPYPFEHANLTSVATPIEDWDVEPARFEAILCISTIEHVGLGWYGEEPGAADADVETMALLARLLRPQGVLVLSVPYGTASVSDVQRTYDGASLSRLLEGWEVLERDVAEKIDERSWNRVEDSDGDAVAMVIARPAGSMAA